jgi:hypothetical protein
MNGMPRATRQLLSGSGKSYVRLWTRSPRIRKRGHAIAAIFDGMSFPDIPSASFTAFAIVKFRSSLSRTVADTPGTGDRDSATPSNEPLERAGMNSPHQGPHASAGRSAPSR